MTIIKTIALAAGLLCGGAALAQAQDHQALLTELISSADALYASQGYERAGAEQRGELAQGAAMNFNVSLVAGREYQILGVCDYDCSDLDLTLFGARGDTLAKDELEDDAPIVSWTAPESGDYRLEVRMYACSTEPCYFAFATYVR